MMLFSTSTSVIDLPKTTLVRGIPFSSRKRRPMSLGPKPSLDSAIINEDIFPWLSVSHGGRSFEVGREECDLP
jgi:hypothetical protein